MDEQRAWVYTTREDKEEENGERTRGERMVGEVTERMSATISAAIEPLIRKKIFNTEEEAIRVLTREYILRQISALRRKPGRLG